MFAVVLEHSGFCDVRNRACQKKMHAVNQMPLVTGWELVCFVGKSLL